MSSITFGIHQSGVMRANADEYADSHPTFSVLNIVFTHRDSNTEIKVFGALSDFARFQRIAEAINAPEVEAVEAQSEDVAS